MVRTLLLSGTVASLLLVSAASAAPGPGEGGILDAGSVPSRADGADSNRRHALRTPGYSLDRTEDFPAVMADGDGRLFLAVIARPSAQGHVRVYRFDGDGRRLASRLRVDGATAVGPPAMASGPAGGLVTFAVEVGGRWRIAWALLDAKGRASGIRLIDAGRSNTVPAVARAGGRFCVVFESNTEGRRAIYASFVDGDGATGPRRISRWSDANNPSVAATADGRVFAVWDAVRHQNSNLFGAWRNGDGWGEPKQLTDSHYIERHAHAAAHHGDVWLAWQAQTFPGHRVNGARTQRVSVAKLGAGGGLRAPSKLNNKVFARRWMSRPRIAFGPRGHLLLTARRSLGTNSGWAPMAWRHDGESWSGPKRLWPQQGRWRPVPLALTEGHAVAAVQRDDLPRGWVEQGERPAWECDVVLRALPRRPQQTAGPIETKPLDRPETDFRLADHIDGYHLDMPEQQARHAGRELNLYWGDLHEHTAMSVCVRRANPPIPDLFANQRDLAKLDFTAITDHGYNLDQPQWAYTTAQVRAHHEPGRFLTLLGQEWTSSKAQRPNPDEPIGPDNFRRYGHRNLIFEDPALPHFFDAFDGDIPPEHVWEQLTGHEFIMVPHQLADWKHEGGNNPPTDWRHHHEHHQPLAEIFQQRGSYEDRTTPRSAPEGAPFDGNYLQDAWARGIVIGVIASPDHGGGNGLAGVWADELTREALFEAFHARHTFGTSGAKISLLVESGGHMMGDKVTGYDGGPVPIHVEAKTDKPIERIVILRNNEPVHTAEPAAPSATIDWTDRNPPEKKRLWYYVRVVRSDDELAWSSPIWLLR